MYRSFRVQQAWGRTCTMKTLIHRIRTATAALAAGGLLASQVLAQPLSDPDLFDPFVTVQADCYSIGQEIAAQQGGTLARASQSEQGGQTVCIIVVLVPGKDGQRPRRQQFVVPAG